MHNKDDLINYVATHADISKRQAEKMVNVTLLGILDSIGSSDGLRLTGFGTFHTKQRKARTIHSPAGKKAQVKAKRVVTFRPGHLLKRRAALHETF